MSENQLNEYRYVGCTTAFSENSKTNVWQPDDTQITVQHEPSAYADRLVGVGLLVAENGGQLAPIGCTPMSSQWSRPMTWEMVNKPDSLGGVTVDLSEGNCWIDLKDIHTIDEFFARLLAQANSIGMARFHLHTRKNIDGSMSVQYVPTRITGDTPNVVTMAQRGDFYVYDESNIGNNAESVIYLADAFDSPPSFMSCVTHSEFNSPEMPYSYF